MSSPVAQQLSGLETDAGAGAGSDNLSSSGTRAPASAFHLARLWPFSVPQPCLCGGLVTADEAQSATATDDQGRTIFAGWRHAECVGL